ncbi:hypothetical protein AURDEDRAFT_168428 [Auricularia subglabra TFB-10046 SS5]|nr:hypothetical protein AURDEDRAFT_168428 [Auricularia subglabra TFB-10046 SS5]
MLQPPGTNRRHRSTWGVHGVLLLLISVCALLAPLAAGSDSGQGPTDPGLPSSQELPEDYWYQGNRVEVEVITDDADVRLMESWEVDSPGFPEWFPAERRFFVRRWTSDSTSWVSPNSPTSAMPRPPALRGPRACGCLNSRQQPVAVYGEQEHLRQWTWLPDWYDSEAPWRAFAPGIWNGMGPCPRLGLSSVLHRLPTYLVDEEDDEWHHLVEEARREMEAQQNVDENLATALFTTAGIDSLPRIDRLIFHGAADLTLLHNRWAAWVYSILSRRARLIYEVIARFAHRALAIRYPGMLSRLARLQYFGGNCPVCAWFDDPVRYADIIRQYILWGIPVYYRWDRQHDAMLFLADLAPAPPQGPSTVVIKAPPLTPRRARPEGGNAAPRRVRRQLHWNTERTPPSSVIAEQLVFIDDTTMHHLLGHNPERQSRNERMPPLTAEEEANSSSSEEPDTQEISTGELRSLASMPSAAEWPELSNGYLLDSGASVHFEAGHIELVMPGVPGSWGGPEDTRSAIRSARLPLAARIASPSLDAPSMDLLAAGPAYPSLHDFLLDPSPHEPFLPTPRPELDERCRAREIRSHADFVAYCLQRYMSFHTLSTRIRDEAAAPGVNPESLHRVPPQLRIHADTPSTLRLDIWARGVREVLSRPHVRAALTQGGLLARLAVWAGLTEAHVLGGPSSLVRTLGAPRSYEFPHLGLRGPLVDDYFTEEEVATLIGAVVDGSSNAIGPTLWPTPVTLGNNWWQGQWTDAHEEWFTAHLRSLLRQRLMPQLRPAHEWRRFLRDQDFRMNGGRRQGRNG